MRRGDHDGGGPVVPGGGGDRDSLRTRSRGDRDSRRTRRGRGIRRPRGDRGAAAVEYLGFLPLLLLVALAGVQLGIAAYAAQQAGTAARAAARTAAQHDRADGYVQAAKAAMSGWVGKDSDISAAGCPGATVTAKVTVPIPSVFLVGHFGPVTKTATMPCDDRN